MFLIFSFPTVYRCHIQVRSTQDTEFDVTNQVPKKHELKRSCAHQHTWMLRSQPGPCSSIIKSVSVPSPGTAPPRLRLRHQNSVAFSCPNESLGSHVHQLTIAAGLSGEGGSSASVSCMDTTAAGGWMACTAAAPGPDTTSLIRFAVARIFCMARRESARVQSTLFYPVPCNPAEKHLHKAGHTMQFGTARSSDPILGGHRRPDKRG